MATRCYIAKQVGPDKFRTVFCHFDGYLEYVGAILAEHYDTEEKLDRLLDVGDIDMLYPQLDPDPDRPHSQQNPQENVTRAYGRDYGDPDSAAKMKSLRELDDDEGWIEYVYVFTADGQWKYFHNGQSQEGMHDLKSALANLEIEDPSMDQSDEEAPFPEITEGESNMIKLTLRWGERYTEIELPCGDEYLAKRLAKLDIPGDLPTNAYVLSVSSPREAKQFTIHFRDPEGNAVAESVTVDYGSEYELPKLNLSDGVELLGWSINGEALEETTLKIDKEGDIVVVASLSNYGYSQENPVGDTDNANWGVVAIAAVGLIAAIVFGLIIKTANRRKKDIASQSASKEENRTEEDDE